MGLKVVHSHQVEFVLLVATTTVITASEDINDARTKRDIAFFKNLITGKLFHSEGVPAVVPEQNYRLFKIPGFKNVLVKAVPKVKGPVEEPSPADELKIEDVHPSIALVSSYLGTKTLNETLSALEGMKALLQSGVLSAREGTGFTTYGVPVNMSPYSTETLEVIDMDGDRPDCKFPLLQHPVPIPYTHGNQHRPVKIPLPDLPYSPRYSYKQIHGNGMTTYTSNDDKNVIVTESKYPVPLPEYLNNRFQNILALGFRPAAVDTDDHYYKYLNRDGSVSIFSGSGVVEKGKSQKPIYPFDPHHHVNVEPSFSKHDYSNKHLHQYSLVGSYSSGSGVVEQGKNKKKPLPIYPFLHKPLPVSHIHDPPKVIVAPPLPVAPVPNDYSYKQIHEDGSVSTYSGSGIVEEGKRPHLPIHPFTHKPMPVLHFPDPPKVIVAPHLPVAPVPNDYSYTHIHEDGSVSTHSGSGVVEKGNRPLMPIHPLIHKPTPVVHIHDSPKVIVAPPLPVAPVPNDYSYTHIHKDGSVSTYSGSGVAEQSQKIALPIHPLNTKPLPVVNIHDPPIVSPTLPVKPMFVANGYSYKHSHQDGSVTNYYGSGVEVEEIKSQKLPLPVHPIHIPSPVVNIHELPKVKVPHHPHESPIITNDYSYKHVHQDGSVTTYSGQGHKIEKPVVPLGTFEPLTHQVPAYEAPHIIESSFIPTKVPSVHTDYSYNHLHNDGTVTTYSNEGMVENSKERPAIIVEEVRHPAPLPSFLANRIENVAATAYKVTQPLAVIEETVYGPPIPVYQEPHPILLEQSSSFKPKPSAPSFNGEVNINVSEHNSKVPSAFSYQTVHQGGISTNHFASGLTQEKNTNDNGKMTQNTQGNQHYDNDAVMLTNNLTEIVFNAEDFRNNTQIGIDSSKAGKFSFTTVHRDGSTSTYSGSGAKPQNKLPEHTRAPATRRRLVKKVVRRPSIKSQESNYNNINEHKSNHQIVDGLEKIDVYTKDSTLTSSDISLSANPIVVLPDEHIFSYKQNKAGSSITVLSDNIDNVSVVEENRTDNPESHRGDIPDASYELLTAQAM
ncbi:unnamed protein product [Chilo suppressalis]|uniref:Uncharacterized protein n=1 Tax=Chilo suppressalis TaxID=168631 RepID=A0ABN8AVW9_CHISP|nr:unnamed protein product [Chilo suppressalis]